MPSAVVQWIEQHQKQAALGAAGLGVVLLALRQKKKTAAAAAANSLPVGAAGSVYGVAPGVGGIGIPATTLTDGQSAVQHQINDNRAGFRTEVTAETGRIPAGARGAA